MIKLEDLAPEVAKRVVVDAERIAAEDEARQAEADRRDAAALRTAIEQTLARVPPAYAGAELDARWLRELVGEDAIAKARDSLGEARVTCLGVPGAGKTSMLAAMFRMKARGFTSTRALRGFRWTSSHKLAKARAGQPLGEGEAPLVESCLEASLLVLDELGAEDPRYASAVGEVLYERHEQALPTWVTTGVGPKEISARYGGGISRRVFENAAVFRLAGRR
jgi:DNA replication protein DnaC